MRRWQAEAWPILKSLMSEEDMLISAAEEPAIVVRASCDQLGAVVDHAQEWLDGHRCPDANFGLYFEELISACRGLCAIMVVVAGEAPDGRWLGNRTLADKVGEDLMDRIAQASTARRYLRPRQPGGGSTVPRTGRIDYR